MRARVALCAPAHLAQAQDGASACRPPVRLDVPAGRRLEQQRERPAVVEQAVQSLFSAPGLKQPPATAEPQQLGMVLRQARYAGQRVRHDAHALALLPEHQHLRLALMMASEVSRLRRSSAISSAALPCESLRRR